MVTIESIHITRSFEVATYVVVTSKQATMADSNEPQFASSGTVPRC